MSPLVWAHAPEPEMRLMAADMQVGSFPAGVPPQVPGTLEPCRRACIWAAQCALRADTPTHVPGHGPVRNDRWLIDMKNEPPIPSAVGRGGGSV